MLRQNLGKIAGPMNKSSEMKSAAARLAVKEETELRRKVEAERRAEKEKESEIAASKTARLRALRLAREAALREAVCKVRGARTTKRP